MVRIAHLADIHIQDRRRAEYAAVFARLYASLREERPDIIVVAGDVFDNKMRASPHNLEDVADFLMSLSAVAPTVLIAGNHDTNVLTPGALDLLTPVVQDRPALQPPRLTYWRSSGTYAAHGLAWTVIATDGAPPAEEEERRAVAAAGLEAAPHLCLFHTEVNGAQLPNGQELHDFKLTAASFGRYDLTLGGHIHLRQRFAPRAAYCGSLIQQNIGEPHLGHGYLMWELAPSAAHPPYRTAPPQMRGVDIPNPHGYLRVEVDAAGNDATARPLPDAPLHWELAYEVGAPNVDEIAAEYATLYGSAPRARRPRVEPLAPPGALIAADAAEGLEFVAAQNAANSLRAHEQVIREILGDSKHTEAVCALHRARWKEPPNTAGGKFRLLRLEFDNMYIYGPANVVDFTALEGCVSGIISDNHTGKSSFLEALLFALYEDYPRAPTKKDIIHMGAASCRMTFEFELDGKLGRVTKGFDHGSQAVSQYRFEFNGEDRTRGGTVETLVEVQTVLGKASDALASSFHLQGGDIKGFASSTPDKRKKLLSRVLGLGSFDELDKAIASEYKKCKKEVQLLEEKFRGTSEGNLEYRLDVEIGNREDLEASIEQRIVAATALANAAAAAAHDYGVAVGESKGAQAAADRAQAASAATVPDLGTCEAAHAAWAALVGDLLPAEMYVQPAKCSLVGRTAITPADIEAGEAAARLARAAAAHAAAAAAAAERARPPRPFTSRDEAAARLHAAAARERATAAPDFSVGQFRPRPVRPAHPRPPAAEPAGDERSGPRPTASAIDAALRAQTEHITDADRATAALWAPAEYERTKAALVLLGTTVAASPGLTVSSAAAELKRVAQIHDQQAQALASLGASAAAAAAAHPAGPALERAADEPRDLKQATDGFAAAKAWAEAAAHLVVVRSQLRPRPGCPGCEHAHAILCEDAPEQAHARLSAAKVAYERAQAREYHTAAAAVAAAAEACLAAAAAERAAKAAALRERLVQLEAAHVQRAKCAVFDESTAVLQVANYWHTRDVAEWQRHDEACAAWEAEYAAASSRHAADCLAARANARQAHDDARAHFENVDAAWETYEAAVSAAAAASARAAETATAAQTAEAAAAQLATGRRAAVSSFLWWRAAVQDATAAVAAQCAAKTAAAAAKCAAARVAEAKETADRAHQAHAAARESIDKDQHTVVSAARVIAQLEGELIEERRRTEQHADAVTRRDILKAYRTVLRPTGGIGDVLLGRGRAAIQHQLNESLRELGAAFEVEIAPNFDLRHQTPSGALSAKLGGGYQHFVLCLAARLTIWRHAVGPRPDALFIDEGFGACDAANLAAVGDALEALATAPGGPRLVFVVTHVEALKARLGRALEIGTDAGGSRLTNTVARGPAGGPAAAARPVEARPAEARPAAARPGQVYCAACGKSLPGGRAASHQTTKTHRAAVARAAARAAARAPAQARR